MSVWSSDVCSSDLLGDGDHPAPQHPRCRFARRLRGRHHARPSAGSPEAAERYAMSRLAWLRLPWLFNRRVGVALLWTLLVLAAPAAGHIARISVVVGVAACGRAACRERVCQLLELTG